MVGDKGTQGRLGGRRSGVSFLYQFQREGCFADSFPPAGCIFYGTARVIILLGNLRVLPARTEWSVGEGGVFYWGGVLMREYAGLLRRGEGGVTGC